MEQQTFFDHYRVCVENGQPVELSRIGDVTTYKAVDIRSGDPVAIRLIPRANVVPALREQFEAQAAALQTLDHINIPRVFVSGEDDNHFVFVSEFLQGQTIESWVRTHGPMTADAVLRVALQVVSALGAADFHHLTHRAIQPSNLMIVPGQMTDGGWPLVKLINFSVAGLRLESDEAAHLSASSQFASPEQLQTGAVDFRSAIYSLAASMCFMLTGEIHSGETLRKNVRRFPKQMRGLLAAMLRENPATRPHDPVLLGEEIRERLAKIEKRQSMAQKLGIALPSAPAKIKPARTPRPLRSLRPATVGAVVAFALLLLLGGFLFSNQLMSILRRDHDSQAIGKPVGIPEVPRAPFVQNVSRVVPPSPTVAAAQTAPTSPPAIASTNTNAPQPNAQSATNVPPSPTVAVVNPPVLASNTPAEITKAKEAEEPPPPSRGPDETSTVAENSHEVRRALPPEEEPRASQSKSKIASSAQSSNSNLKSKRAAQDRENAVEAPAPRFAPGTVRVKFVGMTPDGRVKLRLPSGEVVIVTPRGSAGEHRVLRYRDESTEPPIYPPDNY